MTLRKTRLKWRCLVIMHSTTFKENQTEYHHKHLIPTVKYGGEGVLIWACATGAVHLAVSELTTNFSVCQSIVE